MALINTTDKLKGGLKKAGASLTDGYTVLKEKLIRYAAVLTIGLGVLAYLICVVVVFSLDPTAWGTQIWILIFPIVGAILYLVFVQKSLQTNFINKKTHLFLIISTGLACAALFLPGIFLFILFIEKSIRNDTPFWVVLTE